ncbi:lactate utilization protein B [Echinicola jeungdonensis]|uniref:Lactate utilization protein B n=1 Tax=Echinicola jeungdonensis TaxID=709343 RepID=A0ABV5J8J0_9BACT|nr:lactate utilization protein B [Echinicola jeungdonensis]MDN3669412.1 lactate utilization protein B [Echinicola jeungdonensis]
MKIHQHAKAAEEFIKDDARTHWHDDTLWHVRQNRDKSAQGIPEWETLRDTASATKDYVLSHIDELLVQFEENAKANGVEVLWAKDAEEHNQHVYNILKENGVKNIVKSKSILTEECGLNHYLEDKGYDVVDTDLGERIIQFAKQAPSHIVLPAIHLKKQDIGEIFHDHIGTNKGAEDPQYLTEAARQHLRKKFVQANAAITGVNFGIAETGGFVVCTNEGNADMGTHLADIHIACMGIEKLIPRAADLGVFLRLLARSATGQSITNYSSHFHKPAPGKKMYIILVDNGRTKQLGREDFKNSLKCIRCGACMNTCPIYRRSGGYSYNSTVPGPIGSILSPGIDLKKYSTLPFASTLCGSCSDVCPVKINIHEQLYKWRQFITENGEADGGKKLAMKLAGYTFGKPVLYDLMGGLARKALKFTPDSLVYSSLNVWGKHRDLPDVPKESFKEWYQKNRKK